MNKNAFPNKPIQNHDLLQLPEFAIIERCPSFSPMIVESFSASLGDVRHDEA